MLSIPIQAVTTRADSIFKELADSLDNKPEEDNDERDIRETIFLVSEDGTIEMREVKTGIQDNNYIQILEGIEVGEQVITAPYSAINKKLQHDSPIEVVSKDELFKPKKKKGRS